MRKKLVDNTPFSGEELRALTFAKLMLPWKVFLHSGRVAQLASARGAPSLAVSVAWLHDVVEDSKVTPLDLYDMGFSWAVVEAVKVLSRKPFPEETYADYIGRVKAFGGLALTVKLLDIEDHLAQDATLTDKLRTRYLKAQAVLEPTTKAEVDEAVADIIAEAKAWGGRG
jgi:hypothetical protein